MILTILQVILKAFGLIEWAEKLAKQNDDRRIGQEHQELASARATIREAKDAQTAHDNVVRMPDSALDAELRNGSEPLR